MQGDDKPVERPQSQWSKQTVQRVNGSLSPGVNCRRGHVGGAGDDHWAGGLTAVVIVMVTAQIHEGGDFWLAAIT
ncbi:MAG: hypothetical protein P8M13_00515 [Luminiphilus sp.]|nr:hypothetical protein [Luminiphilus sp.]